jgi:hypothetical protein
LTSLHLLFSTASEFSESVEICLFGSFDSLVLQIGCLQKWQQAVVAGVVSVAGMG